MIGTPRSVFGLTLRRCLWFAALPTAIAGCGCLALATWARPAHMDAPAAAVVWLELAMFLLTATVATTAVVFWPTFAARRPGAEILLRLQRDPWQGCAAAAGAALVAQLLLSLPLLLLLAIGLDAPATAYAHRIAVSPQRPLLTAAAPDLQLALPAATAAQAVELRPLAAPPTDTLEPSRVAVSLDGQRQSMIASFDQDGLMARIEFPPHRTGQLSLHLESGNVPLFFPPGSVVVVDAAPHTRLANLVTAAFLWLLPTALALAIACLCGSAAALPTVITTVLALLFLQSIGEVGPAADNLRQLMRGQWIAHSGFFTATVPSLTTGLVAMIGAMLLRRRPRA